jgi:tetratricopeptide (TPR) repeat protein
MVLRVARGTDYLGLLSARREARAKAEATNDTARVAQVEAAFRTFVDGAESRFREAVEAAPEDAAALCSYANFLQTIESFDEAQQFYQRTIAADPNNADALNNLAMLLHEQKGDMVAADAMYARGSAANPEDVDLLFNWATLKRDGLGDAAAANVLIDQVLLIKPQLAEHPLVEAFRNAVSPGYFAMEENEKSSSG